jgi:hypothetical protein
MANWQQLSEHRRTAKGMLQTSWPLLMLGGICLGIALMFCLLWSGRRAQTDLLIVGVGSLFIALPLLGTAMWKAIASASPVQLFEEGLHWCHEGNQRERGWDEVSAVYRKEMYRLVNGASPSDWNRHTDLRLVFVDGEEVHFNHSLSDYNRLADFVQRATANRLLPAARREMDGAGVAFGNVLISRDGLKFGRELYPWPSLESVRVANGYLCWTDNRYKRCEIAMKDIPNCTVLLQLLQEMRQPAGTLSGRR